MPILKHFDFGRLRFLDLYYHLGCREDISGTGDDLDADRLVLFVRETRPSARPPLDKHFMARSNESSRYGRNHADTVFLRLDLVWDSNFHGRMRLGVELGLILID